MKGNGETMIEHILPTRRGDATIPARLAEQKAAVERTMERLDYKIARYDEAIQTGKLKWA